LEAFFEGEKRRDPLRIYINDLKIFWLNFILMLELGIKECEASLISKIPLTAGFLV
jgi:hypothetical protein